MDDDNNASKIDQVAAWLGTTVASAFFSSLERFSCVNVSTADYDDEEAYDIPLTLDRSTSSVTDPHDVATLPV